MQNQQSISKFSILNNLNYSIIEQQKLLNCKEDLAQKQQAQKQYQLHIQIQPLNDKVTPQKITAHKFQLRKRLGLFIPSMKQIRQSQKLNGDTTASSISSNKKSYKKLLFQKSVSIQNFQDLQKNNALDCQKVEIYQITQLISEEPDKVIDIDEEESVILQKQNFCQKYKIIKKIGQGAHSVVYKCKNTVTNQFFAAKVSSNIQEQIKQMMMRQYKLLKVLNHKDVLKVYELIFDSKQQKIYMISELCQYFDLRREIVKRKFLNQSFAQEQIFQLIYKILEALVYLQISGVCHRDIKPQNILYNPKTKQIKLIDFDISKEKYQIKEEFSMWTITGSLHYKAPESFFFGYDQKIDIWSVGIILYELINGEVPFNSQYQKDTIKNIKTQQPSYQNKKFSAKAKFLLTKMLQKQAKLRISCKQSLNFLNKQNNNSKDDTKILQVRKECLRNNITESIKKKHFQEKDINDNSQVYRIKMDFQAWDIKNFK